LHYSRALALYIPYISNSLDLNGFRAFSQAKFLFKNASKSGGKSPSTKESNIVDDPYDFSTLEAGIGKALEKLTGDLSKLRTGGRFNPELLEAVRVHLSKDSKTSVRLGELAQVLPKGGRSVVVLVGEAAVGATYFLFIISYHVY
jgi:ribosome recycling factor